MFSFSLGLFITISVYFSLHWLSPICHIYHFGYMLIFFHFRYGVILQKQNIVMQKSSTKQAETILWFFCRRFFNNNFLVYSCFLVYFSHWLGSRDSMLKIWHTISYRNPMDLILSSKEESDYNIYSCTILKSSSYFFKNVIYLSFFRCTKK